VENVVLKTRVPFEEKKLELSIYTFDETLIEQSFQEALLDESLCFYNFKSLSNDIECISLQVEDVLLRDDDDWMIRFMQSLKRTNQKNYRSKLKKIKNKLERI